MPVLVCAAGDAQGLARFGPRRAMFFANKSLWLCAVVAIAMPATLCAPAAFADDPPPPPPPPVAETPPPTNPVAVEADRLSDLAKAAYKDRKYAEAYALFDKAFAVEPRPAFIYNMAKCKERLAEYAEAVKQLQRYLETYRLQNGGLESPDAADVRHQIDDLKRRAFESLPEVAIQSSPPGAQVLEAGVTLGSTPLTTHMKPGRHNIVLKLDKHSDLDAELEVPQSGKVSVVLSLKSSVKRGAIAVWCNVKQAQVAIDGKIAAVTPFEGQIEVEPGPHQVGFSRINYAPAMVQITVPDDRLVRVRAHIKRTSTVATFRSYLGWPMMILGLAAAAGGGTAAYYANLEYQGTPTFKQYVGYQNLGYGVGAGLGALGLALVIWDNAAGGIPIEELSEGAVFDEGTEVLPLGGLSMERK